MALDGGISQEAHSTFDVRFRVARPTFVSLSGQFRERASPAFFSSGYTARLLFMEDSALLLSAPSERGPSVAIPFSLETTLKPGSTYHLFIEGSVWENAPTGGTDVFQDWWFALEVPELPAVPVLTLAIAAALASRSPRRQSRP